jgi:hypothetical protein
MSWWRPTRRVAALGLAPPQLRAPALPAPLAALPPGLAVLGNRALPGPTQQIDKEKLMGF